MAERILIADDEASIRSMVSILLTQEGYEVKSVDSAETAIQALGAGPYDLVLTDIRMPGLSGIDLLRWVRSEELETEVILLTAYASAESAIEALKLGAFDYVTKPFQVDELLHVVRHALEKKLLKEENILLKADLSQKDQFGEMIGANRAMKQIYSLIERIAPATSTVLIQGESGTGKELVARAIHQRSPRAKRPFVTVNCGGLPETLLESELFGHVKGSFTGAVATKKGLFDMATGGTIFLDEVGEMSPAMQVKLLRTLQERRVRPVGAGEEHAVDIRVITATNQDLDRLVAERRFREDLFYRINVLSITMPPLRDRKEDIPLLATHFLRRYSEALHKPLPSLARETLECLESYHWPGNIRELENAIERAVALAPGNRIEPSHMPNALSCSRAPAVPQGLALPTEGLNLEKTLEGLRIAYIAEALRLEGGVITQAAKRLGLTFRSMRYYARKYGLLGRDGDYLR